MKANVMITYNGEQRSLAEWCEIKGIGINTVKYRLGQGMSIKDALERPTPENRPKPEKKKRKRPCYTCEWWRPLSNVGGTFCCHCLLETGERNGMNEEMTKCTTWEERSGEKKKTKLIY